MLILLCVLWFPYLSAGTIQVVRLSSYLIVRALILIKLIWRFSATQIVCTSLCLIIRVSILIKLIWRFSATQIVRTSLCLLVRASIFLIAGLKFFKFDIQGSLYLRLSIRHCVWLSRYQFWLQFVFCSNNSTLLISLFIIWILMGYFKQVHTLVSNFW